MLQKHGRFNDFPKELLPKLPANGTIVEFNCIELKFDPIANAGRPVRQFPASLPIPVTSKFAYEVKDEKTGDVSVNWADVGMVSGIDKDTGNAITTQAMAQLLQFKPAKNVGVWRIKIGSSSLANALYQYLMLASFVADNSLEDWQRDSSSEVLIRYVDHEAEAKADMAKQDLEMEAISRVLQFDEQAMFEAAFVLGVQAHDRSESEIKRDVRNFAKNQPKVFMERISSPDAPVKARIAAAIQLGIAILDQTTKTVIWNDAAKNMIFRVSKMDSDSIQNEYAEYVRTDAAGQTVDKAMEKAISKKLGEKKKKVPQPA